MTEHGDALYIVSDTDVLLLQIAARRGIRLGRVQKVS